MHLKRAYPRLRYEGQTLVLAGIQGKGEKRKCQEKTEGKLCGLEDNLLRTVARQFAASSGFQVEL